MNERKKMHLFLIVNGLKNEYYIIASDIEKAIKKYNEICIEKEWYEKKIFKIELIDECVNVGD